MWQKQLSLETWVQQQQNKGCKVKLFIVIVNLSANKKFSVDTKWEQKQFLLCVVCNLKGLTVIIPFKHYLTQNWERDEKKTIWYWSFGFMQFVDKLFCYLLSSTTEDDHDDKNVIKRYKEFQFVSFDIVCCLFCLLFFDALWIFSALFTD